MVKLKSLLFLILAVLIVSGLGMSRVVIKDSDGMKIDQGDLTVGNGKLDLSGSKMVGAKSVSLNNPLTIEKLQELGPSQILYSHYGSGTDAAAELEAAKALLPEWVDRIDELRAEHGDNIVPIVSELRPEWTQPTINRDVAGVLRYLRRRDR